MVMWILPVFWGNTAITPICQKTLGDPILPMFSLCLGDVGGRSPNSIYTRAGEA